MGPAARVTGAAGQRPHIGTCHRLPVHSSRTGVCTSERGYAPVSAASGRKPPAGDERPPRQRLLSAAEELFGERSYRRTTVAGICARAGIATGSFYAHFNSKADIFAAVLRQINADLRAAMRAALV